MVANGDMVGLTLAEVLSKHPDYLDTHPQSEIGLSILIKFFDAKRDLSVQVHPDDQYAM